MCSISGFNHTDEAGWEGEGGGTKLPAMYDTMECKVFGHLCLSFSYLFFLRKFYFSDVPLGCGSLSLCPCHCFSAFLGAILDKHGMSVGRLPLFSTLNLLMGVLYGDSQMLMFK